MYKLIRKIFKIAGYEINIFKRPELGVKPVKKKKKKKNLSANQRFRRSAKYKNFKKRVGKTIPQKCWNCSTGNELQVHHILPVSVSHTRALDVDNVVMLCSICHKQFHDDCG